MFIMSTQLMPNPKELTQKELSAIDKLQKEVEQNGRYVGSIIFPNRFEIKEEEA